MEKKGRVALWSGCRPARSRSASSSSLAANDWLAFLSRKAGTVRLCPFSSLNSIRYFVRPLGLKTDAMSTSFANAGHCLARPIGVGVGGGVGAEDARQGGVQALGRAVHVGHQARV